MNTEKFLTFFNFLNFSIAVGATTKTTSSVRVLMWSGTGLYDTKDTYIVIGGF